MRRVSLLLAAVALFIAGTAIAGMRSVKPRFASCFAKRAELRPRSIVVACGDGNFFLTGLRWSSWTRTEARAAGVGHQNLCVPDCASGHFRQFAVAVRLFRAVTCKREGRLFTRLAWRFTRAKPPASARSGVERFPFPNSFHCP